MRRLGEVLSGRSMDGRTSTEMHWRSPPHPVPVKSPHAHRPDVLASALSLRHPDSVSKVASSDFYALVAQVIPVFFIALAFETRSTTFLPPELNNVRGIDSNRARRLVEVFGAWYTLVVTLFLAGGLIAALVGLRLGRPLDFHVFHTAWFRFTRAGRRRHGRRFPTCGPPTLDRRWRTREHHDAEALDGHCRDTRYRRDSHIYSLSRMPPCEPGDGQADPRRRARSSRSSGGMSGRRHLLIHRAMERAIPSLGHQVFMNRPPDSCRSPDDQLDDGCDATPSPRRVESGERGGPQRAGNGRSRWRRVPARRAGRAPAAS